MIDLNALPRLPQRQDSVSEQLADLARVAVRLGMYDASDWIEDVRARSGSAPEMTEDARIFGPNTWVYCNQHLAPHRTGWCTVGPRNKTPLAATNHADAAAECRDRGLVLYSDLSKSAK